MDTSLLVILWVIFMIIGSVTGKKKKRPSQIERPPENVGTRNTNFEIPTLANDPNLPGEEITVFREQERPAEVREVGLPEMYRQRRNEARERISQRTTESDLQNSTKETHTALPLNLTADSAMNAIILSEILGKPKALRRKF